MNELPKYMGPKFMFDDREIDITELKECIKKIQKLLNEHESKDKWNYISNAKREIINYDLDKLASCIDQIEGVVKSITHDAVVVAINATMESIAKRIT